MNSPASAFVNTSATLAYNVGSTFAKTKISNSFVTDSLFNDKVAVKVTVTSSEPIAGLVTVPSLAITSVLLDDHVTVTPSLPTVAGNEMSVATPPSIPSNNKATLASSKICDTGFSVNAKTLTKN